MSIPRFGDGRDGFFENRFGLFLHWGLYSIEGWHEQAWWRKSQSKAQYEPLLEKWDPRAYDPEAWMSWAKTCGLTYVVLTAKHHDGFCLWPSKETDWCVRRAPNKRDVLGDLAAAAKKVGLKFGLYYSCPDWHQKNSINQGGDHQLKGQNPGDEPNDDLYREYVKAQMRELATQYGPLYCWFWDIPPGAYVPEINDELRRLQPGIVINDRGWDKGDYSTPERHVPEGGAFDKATEACESVGQQSWGWRWGEDYFTPKRLMQNMARILPMGGNYLLNIGPKPDGTLPREAMARVEKLAAWYGRANRALTAKPLPGLVKAPGLMVTRRENRLYLVCPEDLPSTGLVLPPIDLLPSSVRLLNDGRPLPFQVEVTPHHWQKTAFLHIQDIPQEAFYHEPLVIEISFDRLDGATLARWQGAGETKAQIF